MMQRQSMHAWNLLAVLSILLLDYWELLAE